MTRSSATSLCVAAVMATAVLQTATTTTSAFTVVPVVSSKSSASTKTAKTTTTATTLQMGLFDGVKEAFSAPALERSSLDSERETPIDRWMGWSVKNDNEQQAVAANPVDFVDSMDSSNYIAVELAKPMGIVFEENDEEFGGIFVQSLKEGGVAAQNGVIQPGDQLVAVNANKVSGMAFDDALGTIVASELEQTKLTLFRGTAKYLYGPTGASQEWLDEFVAGGTVETTAATSS